MNELIAKIRRFRIERNWACFHTPKNLSVAITIEAAELMEHFQWMGSDESVRYGELYKEEVSMELADVMIYCLNLADVLRVDVEEIVLEKLERNNVKYPAEKYKGKWKT